MGYSIIKEALNKRFVRSNILMDNGQIIRKSVFYKTTNTFTFKGKSYIIDNQSIVYEKSKPHLFYFENNPKPIKFKTDMFKIEVQSTNLKDILKSKVITEVVSGNKEMIILYVLVGANLVFSLIILAKIWGVVK